MSVIYKKYQLLKKDSKDKDLFLFKVGAFYIFIDEDANIVSNILGLKLTNFNNIVQKCGFPLNSLNKYLAKLQDENYNVQIIDNKDDTMYSVKEYSNHEAYNNIIESLIKADVDNMSGIEALIFLDNLKKNAISVKGEND